MGVPVSRNWEGAVLTGAAFLAGGPPFDVAVDVDSPESPEPEPDPPMDWRFWPAGDVLALGLPSLDTFPSIIERHLLITRSAWSRTTAQENQRNNEMDYMKKDPAFSWLYYVKYIT